MTEEIVQQSDHHIVVNRSHTLGKILCATFVNPDKKSPVVAVDVQCLNAGPGTEIVSRIIPRNPDAVNALAGMSIIPDSRFREYPQDTAGESFLREKRISTHLHELAPEITVARLAHNGLVPNWMADAVSQVEQAASSGQLLDKTPEQQKLQLAPLAEQMAKVGDHLAARTPRW